MSRRKGCGWRCATQPRAVFGQAAYKLPAIAPGAEATVEVAGVIVARPGERLQTRLVVTGGNLESEAVGSFTPLVRQDVADSWEPGPGAGLS